MSQTEWFAKYEKRIRSAQWKNMRADIARLRGNKCERCGRGPPLELHHKTYKRLGRELLSDLELLCTICHQAADREREKIQAARSAERLERARSAAGLNTYATKKYGEDWQDRVDADEIAEEFDRWLEDHNE